MDQRDPSTRRATENPPRDTAEERHLEDRSEELERHLQEAIDLATD